jgi:hypothetical protein
VIFTGMQSQDRASAQVGVLLAEMLGIPAATNVVEFAFDEGTITATVTPTTEVRKGLLSQCEALSSFADLFGPSWWLFLQKAKISPSFW